MLFLNVVFYFSFDENRLFFYSVGFLNNRVKGRKGMKELGRNWKECWEGEEKGRKKNWKKEKALFFVSLYMWREACQPMCRGSRTT